MLVKKGEYLIRCNEDDTATVFKVLLADDELFCVGEVTGELDGNGEAVETDEYINIDVFSNNAEKFSLEQYGFVKA